MRKVSIAILIAILGIVTFYSCNKSNEALVNNDEDIQPALINNINNRENINFALDSSISLSPQICTALGVQ